MQLHSSPSDTAGIEMLKDGNNPVPSLPNSTLSAGRKESTDFHQTKPKSASCIKHLHSYIRLFCYLQQS